LLPKCKGAAVDKTAS